MNKSQLFTTAHQMAKKMEGDYRVRFAYALTQAWKESKEGYKVLTTKEIIENLERQGLKARLWENYGKSRIYVDGFHYSKSFFIDLVEKKVVCNRPGTCNDAEVYTKFLNYKIA